jgi:hypothetical protein
MACVPGKCPCWPQAELFDAAEMALLTTERDLMVHYTFESRHVLWARVVTQSLAVRSRRRGYVLSTFVCGSTALARMRFDAPSVRYLLYLGVCPNSAQCREVFGWVKGPCHPGRPEQSNLVSLYSNEFASDVIEDLLLSAGAYPVYPYSFGARSLTTLTRQWCAWHARASRRTWTVIAIVWEESSTCVP